MKRKNKKERARFHIPNKRFLTFALLCLILGGVGFLGHSAFTYQDWDIAWGKVKAVANEFKAASNDICAGQGQSYTVPNTSVITTDDTTCENKDLTIDSSSTVTINGSHTFASLTITGNSTLNHTASDTVSAYNQINLTITGAMTIDSGSSINVDARGCPSRFINTGTSICNTTAPSLGTHGGIGYNGDEDDVYGKIDNPIYPGSANAGTAGGVVRISAGSMAHNGTITADGNVNGASGGTVNLNITGAYSGTGTISADGISNAGGGRVAVKYGSLSGITQSALMDNISAASQGTGAGTIYVQETGSNPILLLKAGSLDEADLNRKYTPIHTDYFDSLPTFDQIIIDSAVVTFLNNFNLGDNPLIIKQEETANDGYLRFGPNITLTGDIQVQSGGHIKHYVSTSTVLNKIEFTLDGDLEIQSGGKVDADEVGCPTNTRFDPPSPHPDAGSGLCDASPETYGSHGGLGFNAVDDDSAYDFIDSPQYPGSSVNGTSGGGVIRITATNITNNGAITADGGPNNGGAGGSIYLDISQQYGGTGTISADGIFSAGGGRIAVLYNSLNGITQDAFEDNIGALSSNAGAGTIYLKQGSSNPVLLIKEGDSAAENNKYTPISNSLFSVVPSAFSRVEVDSARAVLFNDVNVGSSTLILKQEKNADAGILLMKTPITITGNVEVQSGGVITHLATTASTNYSVDLNVIGDVDVQAGGEINADALGCPTGKTFGGTICDGAGASFPSHGGLGNTTSVDVYDLIDEPKYPGSAGGAAPGGGVVILSATNLTVNGNIYARSLANGPAGGTINITASGTISGSGTIDAGSNCNGGGGRAAVRYSTLTLAKTSIKAWNACNASSTGTVYLEDTDTTDIEVRLASNTGAAITSESFVTPIRKNLFASFPSSFDLALSNWATAEITENDNTISIDNITVAGDGGGTKGATLYIDAILNADNLTVSDNALVTHKSITASKTNKVHVIVSGTTTIGASASIDVSAKGCPTNTRFNTQTGLCDQAAIGYGSHGGYGGNGGSQADVYDSVESPIYPGSGATNGPGGGVIILNTNDLSLSGTIRAFANDPTNTGAGGSINITSSGTRTGTGTINANGEAGGGGRVALKYNASGNALGLTLGNLTADQSVTTGPNRPGTVYLDTLGATLTSTSGVIGVGNDISFNYNLFTKDTTGLGTTSYEITPEYSTDSGTTWSDMTDAGGSSDGKTGLTASTGAGAAHLFIWDADGDGVTSGSAQVRMRAKRNPIGDGFNATVCESTSCGATAVVTDLVGVQQGNVTINFKLYEIGSASTGVTVTYSDDGGSTFNTATSAGGDSCTSGGGTASPCPLSHTTSPGGTSHTFIWNTTTDIGLIQDTDFVIKIQPTGGIADQTTTFIVDNNAAPSVSITSPSSCGAQTGNLNINYTLTDAASDSADVTAEYSINGGGSWNTATSAGGDSGTSGLTTSPSGLAKTFNWATGTDVTSPKSTVKFRITASDAENGAGTPAISSTFGVNNSGPTTASITDPTTAAGDFVSFSYSLTDAASNTASITPKYSVDNGTTYSTATEKTSGVTPASDGTSSLTTSPGGTSHLFVWDTGTDLASSASGVLFQIEPNDGGLGICGTTSAFNYSKGGGTDLPDVAPTAPIMGVPEALTTTSIKWNFTDTADNESGFRLLDANNVVKVTTEPVATSNISSLTESSLTPNTQYTRKVVAFGSAGDSDASQTASIYTLAEVPNSVLPLYLTDTQLEVNIDGVIDVNTPFEVAQRIAAAEEAADADGDAVSEDGVGDLEELEASTDTTALTATVSEKQLQDYPGQTAYYFQAVSQTDGTTFNSGWVSQSFWRFNALEVQTSYEVKVKTRNGDGVETAFSAPKIITTLATAPPKMSLALNVGINVGGAAAVDALPAQAYTTGQVEQGLDDETLIEGRDPQAVTYASTNRNYVFGGVALTALFLFLLYVRMFGGLHSNTPLWEKKTFILKKIAKLLRAKWIMFTHHPVHAFEKLALRTENGEFLSSYHEYHKHHKSHNRIVVGVALLIAGFVSFYGVVGMELGVSAAALYADNGKEVYRGDTITYQIIYKNSGIKPATSVEIRNPISSAVNFVAGSVKHNNQTIQVTPAGGSLNIPIGQVNGAQSGVIEFKVSIPQTAPQPGLLINQSSVVFAESSLSVVSNQTYNPINAPLNPTDLTQRRDGIDSVYEQFTLNNQGVVRHQAPSSETTETYIPQIVEPEIPPEVPEEPVVPEPETPTEPDEPTGVDIIGEDVTPPPPTKKDANVVSRPSQSASSRTTRSSGGISNGAFSLIVGDGGEIQINGEIIQQEDAVLVRGTGTPGAILEIAVDEFNQFFTTVDQDGNWAVTLDHRNLVGGALEGEVLTFDVSVQVQKDDIVSERVRLGEITLLTRVDGADVIGFGEPEVIRGDNVVEQTLSAIGIGIRKSVEQLSEVVKPIEPEAQVTLSVAAPVLILANPAIASNLPFLYTYLYHGISWLLGALGVRRKRKESWGVVYDAISKDPISLAIVRLYVIIQEGDTRGKLKETTVTDGRGRFTFLVEPGTYRLEVQKAGYRYPSQIVVNTKIDAEYTNVYDGKTIQLAASAQEGGAPTIKADIPLDPETAAQKAQRSFGMKKVLLQTQHAVSKVATPILSVGAIAAGLLTLGSFNATNAIIFWLYIFFALLQYVFKPVKMKSWGVVYDAATGQPVPLAVVNIIDPKFQKLIKTRLTDYQGRYNFLPSKGEYMVQVRKEGFTFPAQDAKPTKKYKQPYKGENFKVAKNQGIVSKDIPIQKASGGESRVSGTGASSKIQ